MDWFEFKWKWYKILVWSWLGPIKRFKESVERLIIWAPVIWRDRDWDYNPILTILRFKLERTRKLHERNKRHTTWEDTVHQLRTCELLLDRLERAEYTAKDWDNYFIKYKGRFRSLFEENKPYIELSPKEQEESSKEVKRMSHKENYMFNQDLEYLFKMFKKHLRGFWD